MAIQFKTVTWYSKLGAVILFIGVIPALTFYLGQKYQETIDVLAGTNAQVTSQTIQSKKSPVESEIGGPKNATYTIDDETVTLKGGRAEVPAAAGSASEIETQLFGEPVYTDMNNDGRKDAVVFLVQNTGGTGVFYYVAAAIKTANASSTAVDYIGSNAVFLGDRIAPQNINIVKDVAGRIAVNYAARRDGEAFTIQPSVGVTKYVAYKNGALIEVTQ
jgi:hypothetical protein